jgi:hypothetical protein
LKKTAIIIFCLLYALLLRATEFPRFPIKISNNKRYFIDADGKPFLYHADTGWQIFTNLEQRYITPR